MSSGSLTEPDRLEGDVRDYIPIVRDQMMRRQMEQQLSMRPSTPPIENAPVQNKSESEATRRRDELLELAGGYLKDAFMMTNSNHDYEYLLPLEELSENLNDIAYSDRVLIADGYKEEFGSKVEALCALNYHKQILLEDNNKLEEVT